MNANQSDKIRASLLDAGYCEAKMESDAEILIFNTCCVRNTAEQKILSHIAVASRLDRYKIAVVGCLAQKNKKFKGADIVLGTHNLHKLAEALRHDKFIEIVSQRQNTDFDSITSKSIEITYGCDNSCTYCIVPSVRGNLISRKSSEIINEFKQTNEPLVFLLGQNVNSYVCPDTGMDFPELLDELCKLNKCMINFMSSHPRDFSNKLVDVIANNDSIEKRIHLPIQSGCDRILELMNRGYTVADYKKKVDYLREKIPNVKITTDVICGFPTETEEEFRQSAETLKTIGFESAFVFPYSRRSGTVADEMEGQIDHKTKKRRTTELLKELKT